MKAKKKVISNLELCYCVAPLQYQGKPHFLVASEKAYPCLLFDEQGNQVDEIWKEPGGTMSVVYLPGTDGAFLATHRFYSPNDSKSASLVLCWPENGSWQLRTLAYLPCVHRFDILRRDGCTYLIACTIKNDYEYKDDWRFPGKVWACPLPSELRELKECSELPLQVIQSGLVKNHGYSRDWWNGIETGIVTSNEGVFRFIPPAASSSEWGMERLIDDPTSDALLLDIDGDGEKELLTIGPFHGDTLRVYKREGTAYRIVFEYGKKIEFAHAVCGGEMNGRHFAVIGHRKGDRDLLAVSFVDGAYKAELLDHDVGPANALCAVVNGKHIVLAANRERSEVAYYTLSDG